MKKTLTKYILIYGKTLQEIADIFQVSRTTVFNWHHDPDKRAWLENQLKELSDKK